MGAITTISLKNNALVEQVFVPNQPKDGLVWWFNRSATVALGHPRVSASFKEPKPNGPMGSSDGSRMYKVQWNVYRPTLEVIGTTDGGYQAVPKKAYENVGKIELQFAERSSMLERQDLRAQLADVFTELNFIDMVDNLNGIYG